MLAPNLLVAQVPLGEWTGIVLHIDLRFEALAIELHVLVRIAGVAIGAAEFAAAIGVHRPPEGNSLRMALVQDRFDRKEEILRPALAFGAGGGGGEARNADQFRRGLPTPVRF